VELLRKCCAVPYSSLEEYSHLAEERQAKAQQRATELLKEEEELLGRLRAAVAEWQSYGQPLSEPLLLQVYLTSWSGLLASRQVRQQIGRWLPYPDVQTEWGRTRHREAELVARIHGTIQDMKADRIPLTPDGVRLRAQLPPAAEWRWPAVHDMFSDIFSETPQPWTRHLAQQDEQLAAKVRLIIEGS
jgi:hypothetical protein